MPDLQDGEVHLMQGSAAKPYELKNVGGVYSCSCPAWRNQSIAIERRSCKHLRKLRGDAAEDARVSAAGGVAAPARAKPAPLAAGGEGGEEAEGPPLLLAERWDNVQDLTGWWMSEKLDGVRAYWDGKAFISRLGNPYYAPDWFVDKLPPLPLDGELWGGRKLFQRTVSIVRRQDKSDHWKEMRYLIFDAPAVEGGFEQRLARCRELLDAAKPLYAEVHKHVRCENLQALKAELARIEALGGEGLMLRKPGSQYVVGRSATLLKVKSFHDAEARVLRHLPGEGKHKGRLGALLVEMPNGTSFSVGTGFSDAERAAPPPVGAIITYRYQELSTGGVPRFPSYVGVRDDVKWTGKSSKVAAATPALAPSASRVRRFECPERFWEVELEGNGYTIKSGAIGGEAQTRTKSLADAALAAQMVDELIDEKLADGYHEVALVKGATVEAAPAKAAAKAASSASKPAIATAGGTKRRFELVEGSSSKFWEISVAGESFTVTYGRIGSAGQSKTKTCAGAADAAREADKLIEEKTAKGYEEVG